MVVDEFNNCSEGLREIFPNANVDTSEIPTYDFGPEYHRTARLYTLAIMFVVSVIGNTMVVKQLLPLTRGRFPKSKILFLNLAAADLFVTFGTMLSQLIWELMDQQWIAGDALCKIFKFSQTYSLCSSTYMLVAIALDRFNAIVRPLSTPPQPKYYALATWMIALLPALPCLLVFHVIELSEGITKCVSIFYTSVQAQSWRQPYVLCVFVIAIILPFLLLLVLYIKIMVEIRQRSAVFTPSQQTASSLPRARIKTLKMTSAILLAFIILNFPYVVQECFISFGYIDLINKNFSALAGVISASNSAVNPYIYLTFQAKKTFIGRCLRNLITIIRSRQWSSASQRKDTSFLSMSSKTSSRFDMNALNAVPPLQAAQVASIINGGKSTNETFV
ncbi:cardioacceleratory peptide receptor-like [Argiope bruennichi]|uniref:Cardioacceleratory peptide receptor like protein n=1 Tax=Argiope bruennichi TaxID=94029 RepID=A0A8T0E2Q8_ARGBR|nr:cardioacceleratory peptide receptor-like [Argiope bruennichi]KAF8764181.1 Cardioacceleratory peptide receptor like protein [Argiope bruennichi]